MPFIATVFALTANGVALGTALTATIGTVGAFLVQAGGSLLISAAAKALSPKPKMASGQAGQLVTLREPVAPREMAYGRVRKGGVIVFLSTRPAAKGVLEMVIVLAAHRVQKIGAVYANGALVIADGATDGSGAYAGKLAITRALGGDTQDAFPALREVFPAQWTAAHRLRGVAAVRLTLTYDANLWPSGIPNFTFDIEGKDDILDPRTGLRGYSRNAALCLADYMAHPKFGIGATIGGDIDALDLIEAANICDETVAKAGGGTEPRYSCDGVVTLDQTPQDIVKAMLTAMAGRVYWSGRAFRIRAGAWRAADLSLTDDDAAAGGFKLTTRRSMAQNVNGVRGQFVSPENDWQPDDFPAYQSSVYLAEDAGQERWRDIALPFTTSASAAQRLAKIELERARRQQSVQMTAKLSAWRTTAGDTVALTRARYGWASKPFEVDRIRLSLAGGALQPVLTLQETSPLVYSWSATEEQIYAAAPRTTLPSAFDIEPPQIVAVSEGLYVTRNGDGVKALVRIDLSASPSIGVVGYEVAGRSYDGAVWSDWAVQLRNAGETAVEVLDIAPGQWEFRARAINASGVRSGWGVVIPFGVTGLSAPPAAITGLSVQSIGGLARLRWTQSPDLDVRIGGNIVLRHSTALVPSWAASIAVDEVPGSDTQATVAMMPGTYLVAARDSSGVLGPVALVATAGATAVGFSTLGMLQEDAVFSGTKTGCGVTDGLLSLSDPTLIGSVVSIAALTSVATPSGRVALSGLYEFAAVLDLTTVRRVRLRRDMDVLTVKLSDRIGLREGTVASWPSVAGVGVAAGNAVVEVAVTADDPAGSAPAWSDWSPIEAAEVQARGVKARLRLTTDNSGYAPRVSRLRLVAEGVA